MDEESFEKMLQSPRTKSELLTLHQNVVAKGNRTFILLVEEQLDRRFPAWRTPARRTKARSPDRSVVPAAALTDSSRVELVRERGVVRFERHTLSEIAAHGSERDAASGRQAMPMVQLLNLLDGPTVAFQDVEVDPQRTAGSA